MPSPAQAVGDGGGRLHRRPLPVPAIDDVLLLRDRRAETGPRMRGTVTKTSRAAAALLFLHRIKWSCA